MIKRRRPIAAKAKQSKKRSVPASARPKKLEASNTMKFDSRIEVINSARKMDPELFGKDLRGRLLALWYSATFAANPQKARIQLLNSVIVACDLLQNAPEDNFAEIAPFAQGWPIVLPGTKERAREALAYRRSPLLFPP